MGKSDNWTDQQARAINHCGSDIVVTASAGTGKTSVLSGRVASLASDAQLCGDVRSLLVVTFTNAAADEMRSRIAERLRKAFAATGNSHLRRQLLLLDGADISTIHSFCQRIIGEYFYVLGIEPGLRIIDEDEQRLIKAEVLEQTIEWAWGQVDLRAALEQLLRGRTALDTGRRDAFGDPKINTSFLNNVISLNNFLDGIVDRDKWLDDAASLAEETDPAEGAIGEKQLRLIADRLEKCLRRLEYACKLDRRIFAPEGHWCDEIHELLIDPLSRCLDFIGKGELRACAKMICGFGKPRLSNRPKGSSKQSREIIMEPVQKVLAELERLKDLAAVNPEYVELVGAPASRQTRVLVELVRRFRLLYAEAKQRAGCMDFADLEHFALRLLTAGDIGGAAPSQTALALRDRYKYILVDEYQDINAVQQAIIDRLSGAGNVFVVGDIKQSIYTWRQARPELFVKKLDTASEEPASDKSLQGRALRVDLSDNFRSRDEVLRFVNHIFSRLMSRDFADIDYDSRAQLRAGTKYKPLKEVTTAPDTEAVELHLLDDTEQEPEDEEAGPDEQGAEDENESAAGPWQIITAAQRQAAVLAKRIRQMVGTDTGRPEFQVYDKQTDGYRPVRYRDIVVLMRSVAGTGNDYAEVFNLYGVPVHSQTQAGFFAATEVSDMLSLLKVLDNPQRDIEFAAVLRSSLFKVTDTELARVREHSTERDKSETGHGQKHRNVKGFYDCVLDYIETGPDAKLRARLSEIIQRLDELRTMARRGSLAELIWQVYRRTGYLAFTSGLKNGRQRRANLLKLHERAIQFEDFATARPGGLGRFVEFVEQLIESGGDYGPADVMGPNENAVRIMSIHKSKGLEFPVVFLAGLGKKFNTRDATGECLVDEADTLGIKVTDDAGRTKTASATHQVIADRKLRTSLAEEMRILYVATTRARERLILTGSLRAKDAGAFLPAALFADSTVDAWQFESCRRPLEWLLLALGRDGRLMEALADNLSEEVSSVIQAGTSGVDDPPLYSVRMYLREELDRLSKEILNIKRSSDDDERIREILAGSANEDDDIRAKLDHLQQRLSRRYAFAGGTALQAKASVTQLTHAADEFAFMDLSRSLQRIPQAVQPTAAGRVDAAAVGAATHLVMQKVPLNAPVTTEAVEQTLAQLVERGSVNCAVAEPVNRRAVAEFFASDLGRQVLAADNVHREWAFTAGLTAAEVYEDVPTKARDEKIVVQGIIDLLAETPAGLLLIDFKTDYVDEQGVAERAEGYARQLNLYALAAGRILAKPVAAKWLYFLTPGCPVQIK